MTEQEIAYSNYLTNIITLRHNFQLYIGESPIEYLNLSKTTPEALTTKKLWKDIEPLTFEEFLKEDMAWKFSENPKCSKQYLNIYK